MAEKTPPSNIKAAILSDKQNTLSIMVEVIKLRRTIENNPITDGAAIDEAFETLRKVGAKVAALK